MKPRIFFAFEYISGPVIRLLYLGWFNVAWDVGSAWRTLKFGWNLD